ncbi:hypothetical protein PV325_012342 [Microctonus aethiopoides]|uniref:Tesmin/TSO1-like CXC domain-containing protein n=1 Tax=Microctonus aethiopoides TaxID=144406 RepID=A0AA39F7T3_9HYME|nr:hypothetical protein PV325_012342 [Microctonus aethiopoides]KAK0098056.1 hypothetical protein PV326_011465 [Microctonus aethiopoides]KAK0164553.1 hypothetical protein PV328_003168 [Microctonus aethiopoides]
MPPKRKTKTQTVKKPLVEVDHNHDDNSHDGAEQNVEDPKDIEIAKLREELRLLKIENESLRKNVDEENFVGNLSTANIRRGTITVTPAKPRRNSTQAMKSKEKGCSCTGNCANKKCGCVKKDIICSEFCKCANTCQNQNADDDDENKENNDENISETKIEHKNNISKHVGKIPSTSSSSDSGDTASTQTEEDERIETNPMKPTRQLPRSPLNQLKTSPNSTANTTVFNDDEVFLPVPKEEVEEELSPPEGIDDMLIF